MNRRQPQWPMDGVAFVRGVVMGSLPKVGMLSARLRRFRLGADNSPALSAQALQPGQFDEQPCGRLRRDPIRDAQALGAGPPGLATCGMWERTAPMLSALSRANIGFPATSSFRLTDTNLNPVNSLGSKSLNKTSLSKC